MKTISLDVAFIVHNCASCGVPFAITDGMDDRLRKNGKDFYCPNGHSHSYGKSEAEKLREQLAAKDREIAAAKSRTENERARRVDEEKSHARTVRQLNGTRGVVSRMKRRLVAGACVCCSKKFKDLERHMKNAHPGFDPDKAAAALAAKE